MGDQEVEPIVTGGAGTAAGAAEEAMSEDVRKDGVSDSSLHRGDWPSPEFHRRLFLESPLAVAFMDASGNILDVNERFASLFGYRREEICGRVSGESIASGGYFSEAAGLLSRVVSGESVSSETLRNHKSGRLVPVRVHGVPVREGGEIIGACAIYEDLSERKALESELHNKSYFDDLTGLPNAEYLTDCISRSCNAGADGGKGVVVLIGLNRFRRINGSLGRSAGDEVLIEVAERIRSVSRFQDMQARCGGDKFAVLLSGLQRRSEAVQVARRYLEIIERPLQVAGAQVSPNASAGVVFGVDDYEDSFEVLNDAEIALNNAKNSAGSRVQVFIPPMHEQVAATSQMELDMERAVAEKSFRLAYQPVVSVSTGELEGFETLLRWEHPTMGEIPPDRFIPLAEETGLIVPLGRWVLGRALEDLGRLSDSLRRKLSMNVNISVKQLHMDDLESYLQGLLDKHGVDAGRLNFEITESVILQPELLPVLDSLRRSGVGIGIDDFGTGYSSLGYLKDMPLDFLKIDKSFISGGGKADHEIITAIINLADSLSLDVVAEGVETPDQFGLLGDMGCKYAQGYLFSRPVPLDSARVLPLKFK
jgi:Amt family ammonium transporter